MEKKLYRVVLKENNHARADQKRNGYLASYGVIQEYTRGEAIKKARAFGGEIELVKHNILKSMHKMSIMTMPENVLLDDVVKLLKGREAFKDVTDMSERIFQGDIFAEISGEIAEVEKSELKGKLYELVPKKVINQINELAQLVDTDYVMITMN
ncbi:MAG TPA: hypothetical protein VIH28_06965 [Ignavibacteriaceae bacterium]